MSNFQRILTRLTGGIYIPESVRHIKSKTLLHVSDTPAMILSNVKMLIKTIEPDYIVHTGDLIDNIKLELYPNRKEDYAKQLKKLKLVLQDSNNARVIIALGNHDDPDLVRSLFSKSEIYDSPTDVNIENLIFHINHYSPKITNLPQNSDYSLFGHDLSMNSHVEGITTYLNGIENIHLINLETKELHRLDYPSGTNDSRMCKHSIGI